MLFLVLCKNLDFGLQFSDPDPDSIRCRRRGIKVISQRLILLRHSDLLTHYASSFSLSNVHQLAQLCDFLREEFSLCSCNSLAFCLICCPRHHLCLCLRGLLQPAFEFLCTCCSPIPFYFCLVSLLEIPFASS